MSFTIMRFHSIYSASKFMYTFIYIYIYIYINCPCVGIRSAILSMFKYNQVLHSASYKNLHGCK